MAKFNKAFIPLGISGAFVAFGLVGSLAVNAAYNVMYVPEELAIEGAGGEDVVADNPEDLKTELLKVKIYDGVHYAGLKGETSDPQPEEGYYCSIGITVEGGTSSINRKLVVTQNQAGAFYQFNGYMISNEIREDIDALFGFSRHGLFMKFNDYKVSSEVSEKDFGTKKVLENAVSKHRGKWYEVAVNEETSVVPTPGMSEDDYYKMVAAYTAKNTADAWYADVVDVLNSNQGILDDLLYVLDNVKEEDKKADDYYSGTIASNINYSLSFSNKSKPKFTLTRGDQTQEMTIEHINNTKVRIVESGDGDFNDLLNASLVEYFKKTLASA